MRVWYEIAPVRPEQYGLTLTPKRPLQPNSITQSAARHCQVNMQRSAVNVPTKLVVNHFDHNGLSNARPNTRLSMRGESVFSRRPWQAYKSNGLGV